MDLSKTIIINTDNSITEITPNKDNLFSLEELQKIVGGYIEMVFLPNNFVLVVNEEGKLNQLPINIKASLIMKEFNINDFIVGNALYCSLNQLD